MMWFSGHESFPEMSFRK